MRPSPLLLAPFLLIFAGCSTTPAAAPVEIPPPPVVLLGACPTPGDLPDMATGRELAEWGVGWVKAYACERGKRIGLLEAWPR
jgi:hypothetical protein